MPISLPDFSKARVMVVGDVLLDRYWHGATKRISPEAPVPVVRVNELEDRPGGAANVAVNIVALGAKSLLLGYTGDDEAAAFLEKKLDVQHVSHHFFKQSHVPTITKLRVMSRNQQLIRLDFEEDFSETDSAALQDYFQDVLNNHNVVVLSDYAKGTLKDVRALISLCRAKQMPVVVDPKGNDFERYRYATVLTPNLGELEAVVGSCATQIHLVEKASNLMNSLQLHALLVTQGEHGMTLLQQNQEAIYLPSQAREVFDVTGAGDTVIAVLASGIASGASLAVAAELANIAAGIVVAKAGTATATKEEISRVLLTRTPVTQGVVEKAHLLELCHAAKLRGEKVVMTNGCFDILHAGHVDYLEKARALGDRLIIAVNDDASVGRLKGPARPINALSGRMELLAALRAVDWVVPFSEDTPEKLIIDVSPDILVKGGDYTVEQIAGSDHVLAQGGEVKLITLTPGCSTTKVIHKIQEQKALEEEV